MNVKAGKKSNGKSWALSRHKHFKGDCNDAPRKAAKRAINNELKLIYPLRPASAGCISKLISQHRKQL